MVQLRMVGWTVENLIIMSKEEKNTEKSNNYCNITILEKNTTNDHYGLFTDQIVAMQKRGQTIILVPQDLRQLEKKTWLSI